MPGYAELQVCSNYSFLRGASRIEELLLQAKVLGLDALAITDHNTLAGIARAHARATELGVRLVVACRGALRDSLPILADPLDRAGYGRLCRLLTLGKGRTGTMPAFAASATPIAISRVPLKLPAFLGTTPRPSPVRRRSSHAAPSAWQN